MFTGKTAKQALITSTAFQPGGFLTNDGYVGFLPDGRRLSFPTFDEYLEFISDEAA